MGGEPERPDQAGTGPEVPAQGEAPQEGGLKWWQTSERKKFREYGESLITRKFREFWVRRQVSKFVEEMLAQWTEPPGQFFKKELIEAALKASEDITPFEGKVLEEAPGSSPPNVVGYKLPLTIGPTNKMLDFYKNQKIKGVKAELEFFDEAMGVSHKDLELMQKVYPPKDQDWTFPDKEGDMAWGTYQSWIAKVLEDPNRPVIPITFMYHRLATLVISIQERGSGNYYDFSTKIFEKKPLIPRAAFTQLGTLGKFSFLYGATIGRSGKLHGQYVVTIRDTDNKGTIVALLAYAIENNEISNELGATALENYEAEKDLPPPFLGASSTTRAGRAVELD